MVTEYGRCPAFGYECEYVAKVEAQAAEIERLREALLSCPLIARYETAEKFRERQDDWLANTYRAAITGKAEQ
jgi:hypothetical protein